MRATLNGWGNVAGQSGYVLIGCLAYAFHARPRYTDDVDVLFLDDSRIPVPVAGFNRQPSGDFIDNRTGVIVDVHAAILIAGPRKVLDMVIATAIEMDKVRCASLEGMIALKLAAAENPSAGWDAWRKSSA